MLEHTSETQPPGLCLLLDGSVPRGAGLSSSSAVVCCAALATAQALGKLDTRQHMAELCARCERYVGTEGGGMDQATSFLGEEGCAKFIEFAPVRATTVQLPSGGVFVIANSLVAAHKYVTAGSCYNKRVVECRLAARLMAHLSGLAAAAEIRTLGQLQAALGKTLPEMLSVIDLHLHPDPYSQAELAALLKISLADLESTLLSVTTVSQASFSLSQRARHVYLEAHHVLQFKAATTLLELGQLMDASHASCRDNYECSCMELDRLTVICRRHGALGSRLTGAGWGGCVVSLVPEATLGRFMDGVKADYYGQLPPTAQQVRK